MTHRPRTTLGLLAPLTLGLAALLVSAPAPGAVGGAPRSLGRLAADGAAGGAIRPGAVPATTAAGGTATGSATSGSAATSNSAQGGASPLETVPGGPHGTYVVPAGIHKIQHVIVIMQENRSFDSYFGAYPGADGIVMRNGVPVACIPGPHGRCTRPYHQRNDETYGGPHGYGNAKADIDRGKMDGFINQEAMHQQNCPVPTPNCHPTPGSPTVVVGYHDQREVPNYWAYAQNFVLDDHMFAAAKSWSLPEHLYMVSGWSARCRTRNPASCQNDPVGTYTQSEFDAAVSQELRTGTTDIHLAWTDITWLLHQHGVSWGYYVETGTQPDCADDQAGTCAPVAQDYRTPGIWNPDPLFEDVRRDRQISNIRPLDDFFSSASAGTLPQVSWIVPSNGNSEHPPESVHQGEAFTTAIINAAMQSPDWSSTAIFLTWDEWGGLYDNVPPPAVDRNGFGIRVPSLVISPYARTGYVDHQALSSDAYLKFIEDDFLSGARLDPATDGRPDPRPDVRENQPGLGNLVHDFDFKQQPRPPLLLPTNPQVDSPTLPSYFIGQPACQGCTVTPPWNNSPEEPNPDPLGG